MKLQRNTAIAIWKIFCMLVTVICILNITFSVSLELKEKDGKSKQQTLYEVSGVTLTEYGEWLDDLSDNLGKENKLLLQMDNGRLSEEEESELYDQYWSNGTLLATLSTCAYATKLLMNVIPILYLVYLLMMVIYNLVTRRKFQLVFSDGTENNFIHFPIFLVLTYLLAWFPMWLIGNELPREITDAYSVSSVVEFTGSVNPLIVAAVLFIVSCVLHFVGNLIWGKPENEKLKSLYHPEKESAEEE